MKQDLVTSIFAAVVGALVAYFVCGMFLPNFDEMSVTITKLANEESFSLTEPDSEIFNYRSVNPTVEVYVGDCKNMGDNGICNDEIVTDYNQNNQNNNQEEEDEEENNEEENNEEENNEEENNEEENENENQNQNGEENGDNENGTTD